jgi:hypothetical protein
MPRDFAKSRQNFRVCYSACGDLLLNHFLPLAFVFNRISHSIRSSNKSTKLGQDDRAAIPRIFVHFRLNTLKLAAGSFIINFDLTGPTIFDPFEKNLDPSIKSYNNLDTKGNKQRQLG